MLLAHPTGDTMPDLPAARRITLAPRVDPESGHREPPLTLSVHEGGSGPAIVLCHGFPELGYSWRHQFQPLVDAGLRVIVPDQRGYGGSDAPEGIEVYDIDHLSGDMVGLLDALEIERAVFAGHDWGGFVAWAMPILHPDRTAGVIGVNTPYLARSPMAPTQMLGLAAGGDPEKIYILWFQEPGVAESVLDRHPELVFEKLMRKPLPPAEMAARIAEGGGGMNPFMQLENLPATTESLVDAEELDHYAKTFARTGFRGGVSWYRNFDRNWERHPEIGTAKIEHPCLMVTAEWDAALNPAMAADMPSRCTDLEMIMIEECGHWTPTEKPQVLNAAIIGWMQKHAF
jgi:pimeloyl-ACP methyl ester carboxylesterase